MEPNQVAELKRMLQENARLKKMVAERDLEIEVMKEIASKNGRRISADTGSEVRHQSRGQSTQSLSAYRPYASATDVFTAHASARPAITGGYNGCDRTPSYVGHSACPWLAMRQRSGCVFFAPAARLSSGWRFRSILTPQFRSILTPRTGAY